MPTYLPRLVSADDDRVRPRVEDAFNVAEARSVRTGCKCLAILRHSVDTHPSLRYHRHVYLELESETRQRTIDVT